MKIAIVKKGFIMKNFKIIITIVCVLILIGIILIKDRLPKDIIQNNNEINSQVTKLSNDDYIKQLENYQKEYWEIIKRNNVLLQISEEHDSKTLNDNNNDRKSLSDLENKIKNEIGKGNKYVLKLEEIENQYNKNIQRSETQAEMNFIAQTQLEATDKILNEVYKEIKNNINENEFNELKEQQKRWLQDMSEYEKTINEQGFGSIVGLIYPTTIHNIKKFRTFLLILFYEKCDKNKKEIVQEEDFIGNWNEIWAGRIYIKIKKENNKIKVVYGGANSAYSHSESVSDCKYDNNSGVLICDNTTTTDSFLSCNGISTDEDLSKFLECEEEYPDSVKDDFKTYSDKNVKILKIKKGNSSHNVVEEEEYLPDERKSEVIEHYENMFLYIHNKDDIDESTRYYKYKE